MTVIYVYDSKGNLASNIRRTLSNFRITSVDCRTAFTCGEGYELLLLDGFISDINTENSVVLLGSDCDMISFRPRFDSIIIANADNVRQISELAKLSNHVITCGGDKSIISYSSCGRESVVISLNRKITALSGRIIEPLETPISFDAFSDLYEAMAVMALRLLLDDGDSDIGQLYK